MPPLPPVTSAVFPARLKLFDKSKYPFEDGGMRVDAVRRFNRFYTRRVGALREGFLGSPFPLPEARLLYELGHRGQCTAAEIGRDLDLDAGYLSRLIQSLKRRGLVQAKPSVDDARASALSLSAKGRKAYSVLDSRSRQEVSAMLGVLPAPDQARLVGAMQTVESLLSSCKKGKIVLRAHRPGDLGWVVHRHGALYEEEYGWGVRFEGLVAEIAAKFAAHFDAQRERCWIAELDGEAVGSVVVVKVSNTTAQLRLLLVEPRARGRGLGKRLVQECIAFARQKGYRKLVLWTQSSLAAARGIYRGCGFELKKTEPHASFGEKLTGEYWELVL
jgi:DNA-binding MarR family transcriptional regulator/N-acetylglutamate synthase-like GNAT family acetyltransferase